MTREEKILYHQIHPLKLFTDISTGFYAVYLIWYRHVKRSLIVCFVPGALVSLWLVGSDAVDLEPYKRSVVGRYIARNMTPAMQGVRLAGFGVMMLGGWLRKPAIIVGGFGAIVFGWARGLMFR
jgi:glucose uptake protein GlcU